MKKNKICFISSSGGHFSELYNLKLLTDSFESFLITEKTKDFKTDFCEKKYYLEMINRKEKIWIIKFIMIFIKSFFIFIKEKPKIVISTGALCSYPMLIIARFFRKKTIYIESYARIYDLSLTGKKLYKKVSLFIVQWPELLEKYPESKYFGTVYGEIGL